MSLDAEPTYSSDMQHINKVTITEANAPDASSTSRPQQPADMPKYWSTSVSRVTDSKVYIRGYDLEEMIGNVPFAASTFLLLQGRLPTPAEAGLLDAVLSAILDYSLQKSGTVAARYVASANPNMAAALAAGILGVGKNTMDPADAARFCLDMYSRLEASNKASSVLAAEIVEELRARKQRIPGLGHPVFRFVDPRAQKLRKRAVDAGVWGPKAEFFEEIFRAFTSLPGKESIVLNDIGMMALVLVEMGFSPEETTGLAILSTLPGVIAHVSEELAQRRPIRTVPEGTAEYDLTAKDFNHDWTEAGWADE
ncbi:citryl-CoA lyase [Arthrobacter sp. ISL-30]|uniref:citryl-CoA lyase n=1 Tax=Arthrobacter sp. ISL-30 TaxID=2819109 RepID=UPI001BE574FA|nr:citryl-CoA lyase [Arthrobacter sp. ISL-30]MBT2515032.1 citryl-CoA lyase [Arthrobacter sp. ISL-30]